MNAANALGGITTSPSAASHAPTQPDQRGHFERILGFFLGAPAVLPQKNGHRKVDDSKT